MITRAVGVLLHIIVLFRGTSSGSSACWNVRLEDGVLSSAVPICLMSPLSPLFEAQTCWFCRCLTTHQGQALLVCQTLSLSGFFLHFGNKALRPITSIKSYISISTFTRSCISIFQCLPHSPNHYQFRFWNSDRLSLQCQQLSSVDRIQSERFENISNRPGRGPGPNH